MSAFIQGELVVVNGKGQHDAPYTGIEGIFKTIDPRGYAVIQVKKTNAELTAFQGKTIYVWPESLDRLEERPKFKSMNISVSLSVQ